MGPCFIDGTDHYELNHPLLVGHSGCFPGISTNSLTFWAFLMFMFSQKQNNRVKGHEHSKFQLLLPGYFPKSESQVVFLAKLSVPASYTLACPGDDHLVRISASRWMKRSVLSTLGSTRLRGFLGGRASCLGLWKGQWGQSSREAGLPPHTQPERKSAWV